MTAFHFCLIVALVGKEATRTTSESRLLDLQPFLLCLKWKSVVVDILAFDHFSSNGATVNYAVDV